MNRAKEITVRSWVRCAVLLAWSTGTVHAHHSIAAGYDPSQTVEITGTVVEFHLISPHSVLFLDVTNEDGSLKRWEVETNSATNLRRGRGWDESTFRPGDVITVSGAPHRTASGLMVGRQFTKENGTQVGARRRQSLVETYPPEPGATGLSGRWLPPWAGQGSESQPREPGSRMPLTAAALEDWERYTPRTSPVSTCESMNIPTLFYVGYLFDMQVNDSQALLYYELYDVTRRIILDGQPRPQERSGLFGVAVGRMEGDELLIESSGFPPSEWGLAVAVTPNGNGGDVPSSAEKRVIERYSVSDDGRTLMLDYTVEDPVNLTAPFSDHVEMARLADDAPIYEFHCDADSAARFTGVAERPQPP